MNTHNYLKISTKSIKDKILQKVYWHHLYLAIKSPSYCTCTCTKTNNLSFWISEIYSVCRQEAYEINVKSTDTSLPSGLSPLFFIFTNKDFSKFILKYFPPNNNTKSVTTPRDTQTVNHGQIVDSLAESHVPQPHTLIQIQQMENKTASHEQGESSKCQKMTWVLVFMMTPIT